MNIAVYIDADNVSWKNAQRVREIVQRIGTIRKAIAIGEIQRFRVFGKIGVFGKIVHEDFFAWSPEHLMMAG